MKKILFLLVLVCLASCSQASMPSETATQSTTQNVEMPSETMTGATEMMNVGIHDFQKILQAASPKITQTENFQTCIKNTIDSMKHYTNDCVESTARIVAVEKKDMSFCDELRDENAKNSCRYGAILSDINEYPDVKRCDVITEKESQFFCKTSAIDSIARHNKDMKKCDEIMDLDETLEEKIGYKESCMLGVVTSELAPDKTKCKDFTLTQYQDACLSWAISKE